MKYCLTIGIVILSTSVFGQVPQTNTVSLDAYKQIPEVLVVESTSAKNLTGEIEMRYGVAGQRLFLDSNMTYRLISYDCLTNTVTETGTWYVSFDRMLTLDSKKGRVLFDIIKIRDHYYFIRPVERRDFIDRLNAYIKTNKNMHLVDMTLTQYYFVKK